MSKWKCCKCGKVLSSKQSAINHINVVHGDIEPNTLKIKRLKDDECPLSARLENLPSVKNKKAYSFFSPIADAFSDENGKELCWGARGKAQKSLLDDTDSSRDEHDLPAAPSPLQGSATLPSPNQRHSGFVFGQSFNPPFKTPLNTVPSICTEFSSTSSNDNKLSAPSMIPVESNISTAPSSSYSSSFIAAHLATPPVGKPQNLKP